MVEETKGHAAKHAGNPLIDGRDVKVSFGPETVKAMNTLHEMLRKEKADDELLGELASGQLPLNNALVTLLLMGNEANRVAEKTGNREIAQAFDRVCDQIAGDSLTPDNQPVMVHVKQKTLAR